MGKRRFALAATILALLVVLLFEVRAVREPALAPQAPPVEAPSTPGHAAPPHRLEDGRGREPGRPPIAAGEREPEARVRVRSSLGVPLASVELEQADRSWRLDPLADGTVRVPRALRPVRLRAPGHLPAEVGLEELELVLEPHTSLVFQAFPLEHAESCDPFGGWPSARDRGQSFVSAGACGPASWGIAFEASQLHELIPGLDMSFHFDDGTEADVGHELEPGRHDVYTWPFTPRALGREKLRVDIVRAEPGESEVKVAALVATGRGPTRERSSWNEKTAWGRVVVMDYLERFEGNTRARELELGPLVLGKSYVLLGSDLATGDHDRLFFTHDGSPRRLALAHGLRLRGTLDVSPVPGLAQLRIRWRFGEADDDSWFAETEDLLLGSDGSFELALPTEIASRSQSPFPRPDTLSLEFVAGGFESTHLRAETRDRRTLDLGTVRMTPLPTQLVLAAGHGLAAEDLRSEEVQVPAPGRRSFGLSGAQRAADGSLALALQPSADGSGFLVWGVSRIPAPWTEVPALVLRVDGTGIAFRRAADGRYRREPDAETSLTVESSASFPDGAKNIVVGWRWEGIDVYERSWKAAAFERPQTLAFRAPVTGATLWWKLDLEAADAHVSVALDRPQVTLRVP